MERILVGKDSKPAGSAPAIVLHNPKYAHNVGMVLRLASCYGMKQVWFTGNRVRLDIEKRGRVPREERMRGYKNVDLYQFDQPIEQFKNVVPVAIEFSYNSEGLHDFEHPENAVYIFGPEDGSVPSNTLRHCHRFVMIPTKHCLNLATAVSTILWDRFSKRLRAGLEENPMFPSAEVEEIKDEDLGLFDAGRSDRE